MSSDREKYIIEQLDRLGKVTVGQLSRELAVSEVTIRTTIRNMEQKGLLRRTHGGAVPVSEQLQLNIKPGNVFKESEKKKRIAQKAYEYISDHDTIILDDSSINYYLAQNIKQGTKQHLVVITNSLTVAVILSDLEGVAVFMIGGQIGGKFPAAMGDIALETVHKFRVDKAFISAYGVNFNAGITSVGSPQLQVKKAILDVSDKIFVLVDSTKFSDGYIMIVCPLSQITKIITDDGIAEEYRNQARSEQIDIDIV